MSKPTAPKSPETVRRIKGLLREKNGMNQKQLSEKTGLSSVTISNIMTGKKGLTDDAAERIAEALGVSAKFLKGETDYENELQEIFSNIESRLVEKEKVIDFLKSLGIFITKLDKASFADIKNKGFSEYKYIPNEAVFAVTIEGAEMEPAYISDTDVDHIVEMLIDFVDSQIMAAVAHAVTAHLSLSSDITICKAAGFLVGAKGRLRDFNQKKYDNNFDNNFDNNLPL